MYLKSEFVPGTEASDTLAVCVLPNLGLCVRSLSDAVQGAVLDRFTGDIGPEITQHSLQVRPGVHISNTRFIGYLSHSCDPNCWLDMERFELIALRDIAAGELLSVDYAATEDRLHVQFACHCGAPECRQWIVGRYDSIDVAGLDHLASRSQPSRRA